MKKFYLIALMAVSALTVNAQQALNLSTYNGTNIDKYDGQECKVSTYRYMFTGWNTISLPFSLTEDELNQYFGSDCRLEKLVGVENVGSKIVLNFQDCKEGGLEANVPYILHFNGESANVRILKTTVVTAGESAITFSTKNGKTVTMACAQTKIDGIGLYGVLARDNAEATFVKVDETLSGFYATRCYVKVAGSDSPLLTTNHIAAGDISSISDVLSAGEIVDVFNISGMKVATGINASQVSKLQKGVYVVNGQKVLVK